MLFAQVYRTRLANGVTLRVSAFTPVVRKYSTPTDLPVPKKTKVWESVDEAVKDVKSGDVLLCGGKFQVSRLLPCIESCIPCRVRACWYPRFAFYVS